MLLGQYFASGYCYQHGIEVGYVLASNEAPYFTHLLGEAKRDPTYVRHLKAAATPGPTSGCWPS